MITVQMLDKNRQPSTQHPDAAPIVPVNVTINGSVVLTNGLGLIDTGTNRTVIDASKLGNEVPEILLPNTTTAGGAPAPAFRWATIEVVGLQPVVPVTLIVGGIKRADILIGRDVLQFFRFVYDPTSNTYTLSAATP